MVFVLLPSPCWSDPFSQRFDSDIRRAVAELWRNGPDAPWWKAQLIQESGLKPDAVSPVGAMGVCQAMPGTWKQITQELHWGNVSPFSPIHCIIGGAYYMEKLHRAWSAPRPILDRHFLAAASYNAGLGNLLKAQALCGGLPLYRDIAACLPQVTGDKSAETLGYVAHIQKYYRQITGPPAAR